ncbi:MraY family glycosyltransferase [Globicatella sulfidifaciens]|uniref:Undecaprenyl/decaprenyl-phosphate alpha-N-acetylglucosaminyl 1-phosphate transferase n=1 Tax=Globicatella sulfidifaciens TaxID=136093 RepID=A0A7X8H175_9LACT|nr:MraY family glycosyltransferase [Globicatella sulfidifaciens]NLJ19271.1 undecaprenyl/decaprenyl-phosphate alpha-N-acetylglucosaminyl 1-phosphate transferase [Globicatella sulfidifaciens]
MNITKLVIAFAITLISTLLLVIPVKKIALKYGFIDRPSSRKIHKHVMPTLGGLAIFVGSALGLLYLRPQHSELPAIMIGATVITLVGIIDDKFQIRPLTKLIGQLAAASIVISGGVIIEKITLPLIGLIEFNQGFAILITVLWIVGITNAINLIDGLDGLASGVTTIGLISILVVSIIDTNVIVIYLASILIAANIGFLAHNFYPAKIYMGDTGSMFLGFSIAVISTLGLFKNVTIFSFIVPIIILAIPIFDTLFSIVRRALAGENIMLPDKKHIHYRLMESGFSHRATVLIIYGFSALFGVIAILFSQVSLIMTLVLTVTVLLLLQAFAEITGVVGDGKMPLIKTIQRACKRRKIVYKRNN